jgi:hypothetical protein
MTTRSGSSCPTPLLGLGDGEEDDQQRHADAVVEATLHIEALTDAGGQAQVADHRQPEGGVGGGQDGGQGGRGPQVQLRKQGQAGQGACHDGEGEAGAEQPGRHQRLAPQPAQVDPDGVGEQHQGQGGLGQEAHELVGAFGLDQAEGPAAGQQAGGGEDHRLRHHRRLQPRRDGAIADQQQRDGGEDPLVHASSEGSSGSSLPAARAAGHHP